MAVSLKSRIWGVIANSVANYYRYFHKMDIGNNVVIARTAHLDTKINPRGIHIGANTMVLRNAMILAHDYCRGKDCNNRFFETTIGENCVIGVNSIILPGVNIGSHCVVAAGAVVTKSTPPNTIVAGNPAVIVKTGVVISNYGQIIDNGIKVDKE